MVRRVSRRYSSSKRVKSGRSRSLRKRVRSKSVRKIRRRRSKRMRGGKITEGTVCSREGHSVVDTDDGAEYVCTNVAKKKGRGVPVELKWRPAALTEKGTQSFKEQNTSGHIYDDPNDIDLII